MYKSIKFQEKLIQENSELKAELFLKNERNIHLFKDNKHLEEENKKIKVVSAVFGNEEYKKLMKLKLNKLIKEIDFCVNQLKNS